MYVRTYIVVSTQRNSRSSIKKLTLNYFVCAALCVICVIQFRTFVGIPDIRLVFYLVVVLSSP